jgi:hypothetical protein
VLSVMAPFWKSWIQPVVLLVSGPVGYARVAGGGPAR